MLAGERVNGSNAGVTDKIKVSWQTCDDNDDDDDNYNNSSINSNNTR